MKGAFYGLLFGMLFRMPKLTLTMPLGAGIGAGYAFHQAHERYLHRGKWRVIKENYDEKALLEAEQRLLRHSGLDLERFKIHNVPIDASGNFIRTFEIGDRSKPKLVLIHGYGASSVAFWKIVESLSAHYHLIMIDVIGMGASSRPVFEFDDHHTADEFLVEWLEKWRLQMGGLTDFVLAGHSFGGYIGGLYALKYPENVKKLLMLSPLGLNKVPDGFDLMKEMQKYPEKRRPSRTFFTIAEIIWNTL